MREVERLFLLSFCRRRESVSLPTEADAGLEKEKFDLGLNVDRPLIPCHMEVDPLRTRGTCARRSGGMGS